MKCVKCGKEHDDSFNFCPFCGAKHRKTERIQLCPNINWFNTKNGREEFSEKWNTFKKMTASDFLSFLYDGKHEPITIFEVRRFKGTKGIRIDGIDQEKDFLKDFPQRIGEYEYKTTQGYLSKSNVGLVGISIFFTQEESQTCANDLNDFLQHIKDEKQKRLNEKRNAAAAESAAREDAKNAKCEFCGKRGVAYIGDYSRTSIGKKVILCEDCFNKIRLGVIRYQELKAKLEEKNEES